jgi:predicted nuclease with RNAse H fold
VAGAVRHRGPVVGLDLAGSARRTTGFCRLDGRFAVTLAPLHTDAEIEERIFASRPAIVSVDAPLSLPLGRADIEDRTGPHLRGCDRALLARRIRFFPITLGPMRMLTARGLRLRSRLESEGLRVIESYPGGAQDVLGFPRKQEGVERLRRALRRWGLTGDIARRGLSHDELDAATSAVVGRMVLDGAAEALGDPAEGLLYLPRRRP